MSNHEEEIKEITWENSRHLMFPPLISPQNEVWEMCMSTRALSVVMRYMYHYPDLGSASDWLCNMGNSNQLTRSIPCEQRLHFRCVNWCAKSSLCRQPFKSVQKSGRINLKNVFFFLFLTGLEHCVSLAWVLHSKSELSQFFYSRETRAIWRQTSQWILLANHETNFAHAW